MGTGKSKVNVEEVKEDSKISKAQSSIRINMLKQQNGAPNNTIKDPLTEMKTVMSTTGGRNAFMQFLKKEHAEENLSFFEVSLFSFIFSKLQF
jgi:hypothetical protein